MSELTHIEDHQALDERLREILVTGSLYRNFSYTGRECHFAANAHTMQRPRYGKLPNQLRMYCDHEKCKAETWWDIGGDGNHYFSWWLHPYIYTCRNCGVCSQNYYVIWKEYEASSTFIKAGQWPPLTIQPTPELAKALGPENAELYKKGLIDFNFGHGIGAVGYFRRVLENKINTLLDLIEEAARNAKVADEHLAEIEAVKEGPPSGR